MAGGLLGAVTGQFDDEPGGGFADEAGALLDPDERASESTEDFVGSAVEATSPLTFFTDVDESVGRQFDTEPGGGFADDAGEAAGEAAEAATPKWLSWLLDNQETALLIGLAIVVYVASEQGTEITVPSGG